MAGSRAARSCRRHRRRGRGRARSRCRSVPAAREQRRRDRRRVAAAASRARSPWATTPSGSGRAEVPSGQSARARRCRSGFCCAMLCVAAGQRRAGEQDAAAAAPHRSTPGPRARPHGRRAGRREPRPARTAGDRRRQEEAVLAGALEPCAANSGWCGRGRPRDRKATRPASAAAGSPTSKARDQEGRPAVQRPAADVERIVEHRAVPLQPVERRPLPAGRRPAWPGGARLCRGRAPPSARRPRTA